MKMKKFMAYLVVAIFSVNLFAPSVYASDNDLGDLTDLSLFMEDGTFSEINKDVSVGKKYGAELREKSVKFYSKVNAIADRLVKKRAFCTYLKSSNAKALKDNIKKCESSNGKLRQLEDFVKKIVDDRSSRDLFKKGHLGYIMFGYIYYKSYIKRLTVLKDISAMKKQLESLNENNELDDLLNGLDKGDTTGNVITNTEINRFLGSLGGIGNVDVNDKKWVSKDKRSITLMYPSGLHNSNFDNVDITAECNVDNYNVKGVKRIRGSIFRYSGGPIVKTLNAYITKIGMSKVRFYLKGVNLTNTTVMMDLNDALDKNYTSSSKIYFNCSIKNIRIKGKNYNTTKLSNNTFRGSIKNIRSIRPVKKAKCGSLNGKVLDKVPNHKDKGLCLVGNFVWGSRDGNGYYWRCSTATTIRYDRNNAHCKAQIKSKLRFLGLYNSNDYVRLRYDYGHREVLFRYGYDSRHTYKFIDRSGEIKLGANYKYKLIPGKRYTYYFYDKTGRYLGVKGTFIARGGLFRKVDGKCGKKLNTCVSGKMKNYTERRWPSGLHLRQYNKDNTWKCLGINGGKTVNCVYKKQGYTGIKKVSEYSRSTTCSGYYKTYVKYQNGKKIGITISNGDCVAYSGKFPHYPKGGIQTECKKWGGNGRYRWIKNSAGRYSSVNCYLGK